MNLAPIDDSNTLVDLLAVISTLSRARDIAGITEVVRTAARRLSGADGVTFVLRDGGQCFYVDEDAIGPLWKGSKFPMSSCISGWVMLNKQAAVVEDIYSDPRIPIDAYRKTFVKSLAMVPIRREAPIGAIGVYWGEKHKASEETLHRLQALADSASMAFENIDLYSQLQRQVQALQAANTELSRFAWAAAHDLREPCRTLCTISQLVANEYGSKLDAKGNEYLQWTVGAAQRLYDMIGGIMMLNGLQTVAASSEVDLNNIYEGVLAQLQTLISENGAKVRAENLPVIDTEPKLITIVLQNLLANGLKFKAADRSPVIAVSAQIKGPRCIVRVTDNGIGIPEKFHSAVFEPFRRLHPHDRYPGSGLGLSIAKKAMDLLGGEIWIDSAVSEGTSVCLSLPLTFAGAETGS